MHGGGCILFADADDWLPRDAIETLSGKQQESDADFVSGNVVVIELTKHRSIRLQEEATFEKADTLAFDRFLTSHMLAYAPWAHLYKREIIEQAGLEFRADMTFGEDALFIYQYLSHCRTIATTDKTVYYYNRINPNAATKNYFSMRNRDEMLWLKVRRALYSGELTQAERLKEDDMLLFVFGTLYQDYVFFLSEEEAIRKMRETYEMYRPLLDEIGEYSSGTVSSDPIEDWLTYRPFIKAGDYERLYHYYSNKKNYRHNERRFSVVRKILLPLRTFQIFKLKTGYR